MTGPVTGRGGFLADPGAVIAGIVHDAEPSLDRDVIAGAIMRAAPSRAQPELRLRIRGGSPYTLYQALIRCAFSTPEAPFTLHDVETGTPAQITSDLWRAIATTQDPLRLPWPTVQQWARADAIKAGYR